MVVSTVVQGRNHAGALDYSQVRSLYVLMFVGVESDSSEQPQSRSAVGKLWKTSKPARLRWTDFVAAQLR